MSVRKLSAPSLPFRSVPGVATGVGCDGIGQSGPGGLDVYILRIPCFLVSNNYNCSASKSIVSERTAKKEAAQLSWEVRHYRHNVVGFTGHVSQGRRPRSGSTC